MQCREEHIYGNCYGSRKKLSSRLIIRKEFSMETQELEPVVSVYPRLSCSMWKCLPNMLSPQSSQSFIFIDRTTGGSGPIDRRRYPQTCRGKPLAPYSCLDRGRERWGGSSSPERSTVLGCQGRFPQLWRCSGWWRDWKDAPPAEMSGSKSD